MSPARACAFRVVRRVFDDAAYADRAFAAEAADLDPRERALAMRIAYGVVQRRATLDHIAGGLSDRPLEKLESRVLSAIRIGLFQLLYLDGVAQHAAVNETVELVKHTSPRATGLVNAVLRRAAADADALLEGLGDADAPSAAVMHSVPEWLAELWFEERGPEEARRLLRRINEPAESALRVNVLVSSVERARTSLGVPSRAAPALPEGLVLDAPFDVHGSRLWQRGAVMPQSRSSMLVARTVAPLAGERVLDLCAAPGGKTTHLAALMGDRGEVVAVEKHPGRAAALERTCRRMQAGAVRVRVADAQEVQGREEFDRVLVDPPCSGLGTLQSRPDLRWRATAEAIEELSAMQSRILTAGAAATRRGGTLVYSVCTISRAESEDVVRTFLESHHEFELDDLGAEYPQWQDRDERRWLQLLPYRDLTDGFFIARMRRRQAAPAGTASALRAGSARAARYPSPQS